LNNIFRLLSVSATTLKAIATQKSYSQLQKKVKGAAFTFCGQNLRGCAKLWAEVRMELLCTTALSRAASLPLASMLAPSAAFGGGMKTFDEVDKQ